MNSIRVRRMKLKNCRRILASRTTFKNGVRKRSVKNNICKNISAKLGSNEISLNLRCLMYIRKQNKHNEFNNNNILSNDSDGFSDLLGSLKSMDPSRQMELWKSVIDNHPFDLDQLKTLKTAIDERIRLDIISGLPYEIALYIMNFLNPQDLCQAAQTCRSWRTVCEDNRLWREKCKEEGLLDDEQTLEVLFKKRITTKHNKQEQFVNETMPASNLATGSPEWKVAYLKHMNILRNWRCRKFEISEPFIAPSPMQVDPQPQSQQQQPQDRPPIIEPKTATTTASEANAFAFESMQDGGLNSGRARQGKNNYNNSPQAGVGSQNTASRLLNSRIGGNLSNIIDESSESIDIKINLGQADGDAGGEKGASTSSDIKENFNGLNQQPDKYMMQLRCHEDSVITCLQYNPKTNTIVSGSDDQTLKVWCSETGRCVTTLEGHTGGVWSSQLSPDDIVISGSTDRTLKVWKAHSGELLHTLYGHTSTVRCLALDGNYVVSGSRDTTLRLWDITKGTCLNVFTGHSAAVRCVEYKNETIVSGAYDHLVMVWDSLTGTCRFLLECHYSRIYSLQFDGKTIASGSLDSTICIWDAATGKLRHHLEGHTSLTSKMQLKGNLLVSANADSFCKVWNINTGECLQTLGGESKHTSAITSVYFNNRHVVTSSDDGTVKLWDIKTGKFIKNLVVLPTASKGGVVWRIRASYTKLICAVGSRAQTEDTHLLVLDFSA